MKGCNWVPVTNQNELVTSNLVCAGNDAEGKKSFVGRYFNFVFVNCKHNNVNIIFLRALHNDEWTPANVIPSKNTCYVSDDRRAYSKSVFEVLCDNGGYEWIKSSNGDVPEDAVFAREGLYIGRAYLNESLIVGKIMPEYKCIFVPFDKCEYFLPTYDVLCKPQKGKICFPQIR